MDINKIEWSPYPALQPGETEHINCYQKTIMPFADILGMTEDEVKRMGKYFGGGYRCGGTCGPVNAALMLLGYMYGDDDEAKWLGKEYLIEFANTVGGGSFLCNDMKDPEKSKCGPAVEFTIDFIKKHRK